jgi:hypothetical protein
MAPTFVDTVDKVALLVVSNVFALVVLVAIVPLDAATDDMPVLIDPSIIEAAALWLTSVLFKLSISPTLVLMVDKYPVLELILAKNVNDGKYVFKTVKIDEAVVLSVVNRFIIAVLSAGMSDITDNISRAVAAVAAVLTAVAVVLAAIAVISGTINVTSAAIAVTSGNIAVTSAAIAVVSTKIKSNLFTVSSV